MRPPTVLEDGPRHARIPLVMDKLEVPDLPPKRRAELVDLWQQLRGLAGLAITPSRWLCG